MLSFLTVFVSVFFNIINIFKLEKCSFKFCYNYYISVNMAEDKNGLKFYFCTIFIKELCFSFSVFPAGILQPPFYSKGYPK